MYCHFFQLFTLLILQLGKEGNFLSPNPEYLGSTPELPRSNTEYQSSEIGYQSSNPNSNSESFRTLNQEIFNREILNQEILNQERALTVVNQKEVNCF